MSQPAEKIDDQKENTARPVDRAKLKAGLAAADCARFRTWLSICARCGLCADSCFFYQAHDKDPKLSPAYKIKNTLGKLYKKKGNVSDQEFAKIADIAHGDCTACRRCSMYCPFGIDIASMIMAVRGLVNAQGMTPPRLQAAVDNIKKSGNQMAMGNEDWIETCEWMAEEWGEEVKGVAVPVDVQGAKYMYTVNPREPMYYPQDIGMMALIMSVAGESWTVPSGHGWDCTNLAMFAGDKATAAFIVGNMYRAAQELEVEYILMTECGHAYRSGAFEGPYFLGIPGGKPPVPVKHSVELLYELIRDGKIKIDPAKKLKEPCTVQDPCNVSRNGGLWEIVRKLVAYLCEDFRDMSPNRAYNHCCGGGGGYMPMGPEYKPRRMKSGKVKADQIKATGAKVMISPCHNCFDQLGDLNKEYDLGYKVISFKELIVESMIIPEEMKASDDDESGEE